MKPLKNEQNTWDTLATEDAMWSVLSNDSKKGGRWDKASFLETGKGDVSHMMEHLRSLNLKPAHGSALDFGCGLGRVTMHLTEYFSHVVGVDISQEMIDKAQKMHANIKNIAFHHNPYPRLHAFDNDTFDLIFSRITLQHIRPDHCLEYVDDFCRVVKPGGIVYFQAATWLDPRMKSGIEKLKRDRLPFTTFYRKIRGLKKEKTSKFGVYYTPLSQLVSVLETNLFFIAGVFLENCVGDHFVGHTIVAQKP